MGLFKRYQKVTDADAPQVTPAPPRKAYCRICDKDQTFSKCWQRTALVTQCTCCDKPLENPAALYKKFQPKCPACEEPLEQPGFHYGFCDGCGSKFELVEGTRPGLFPNKKQREAMNKIGKAWRKE